MLDIFPKLNGLDGLIVNNLRKKEGNNIIELIMENPIKELIKQQDIIYFDLKFSDVWIDVEMTLKDNDNENKTNKLCFEVKVNLNNYKDELETSLVNLGIKTWKYLKQQEQDYYLLSKVEIISEKDKKNNKNNQNEEECECLNEIEKKNIKKESIIDINDNENTTFNFNDKIICTLIFINITNVVYNMATDEIERRNKIMKNIDYFENAYKIGNIKMDEIKTYFNDNFSNLYLNKAKNILKIDKILCKLSPEYKEEEEEVVIIPLFSSTVNSINNSPRRFIGPYKIREEKKEIEMDDLNDYSGRRSNKNGNAKFESFSFVSGSSIANKSEKEENLINREYQDNYSQDSEEISHTKKESSENDKKDPEEITYIKTEIDYNEIIDNFNPYLLKSFNDSDSDIYKTRNVEFVEGEILKINKKKVNVEKEKKINKEINAIFMNERYFSYNRRLLVKYIIFFAIIIFVFLLLKEVI
jgi:hypothetical protein